MRTQFYVGLLSMLAGGLLGGAAGCSDITAGQPSDPAGPPELVHVIIQDQGWTGAPTQRYSVTDLLDTEATNPDLPCSDTEPCLVGYVEGFSGCSSSPNVCAAEPGANFACSCSTVSTSLKGYYICGAGKTGTCNDPLKAPASGIPIYGRTGDPGDLGAGFQIRVVFSKVLNNQIENVSVDTTQGPGAGNTYQLKDGILELDDSKGMPVATNAIYDNGGTPGINGDFPSDLLQAPLGPALVLQPMTQLDVGSTYTIKLNTAMIKDREGNAAADASGAALGATVSFTFKTEDITPNPNTLFLGDAMGNVLPNEELLFAFWGRVDPTTVKLGADSVLPAGADPKKIEFFQSLGSDPLACKAGSPSGATVNLRAVYTSAPGMPADWPTGTYKLHFTVQDYHHIETFDSNALSADGMSLLTFTVSGMDGDPTMDTNASGLNGQTDPMTMDPLYNFVLPEQCTGM
jgi:hypothetical protein